MTASTRWLRAEWCVGHNGSGSPVVTCEARDIAVVEDYYGDGEANAKLIAAAPAMLAALLRADAFMTDFMHGHHGVLDEVRAAIKLAEDGR